MKTFFFTDSRFKYTAVILLIIFLTLMGFLVMEADVLRTNPCSLCAERMGDKIICTDKMYNEISNTYYPNGSVKEDRQKPFNNTFPIIVGGQDD